MSAEINSKLDDKFYFAMCLIVKNEPDIHEWISYHHRMGCNKFYIYDHSSDVPLNNTLINVTSSGLVEYKYVTGHGLQMPIYNSCLQDFNKFHQFIGFLDADEYIVVKNKSLNIPEALKEFESYGGVVLNWKMFGTSGHIKTPAGGILTNHFQCIDNIHIKSIVNTDYGIGPSGNPHSFSYKNNNFAVDTNHKPVDGPRNGPPLYDRIVEYYTGRIKAGGDTPDGTKKSLEHYQAFDQSAFVNCSYLEMPKFGFNKYEK
eukprot:gene9770-13141_t